MCERLKARLNSVNNLMTEIESFPLKTWSFIWTGQFSASLKSRTPCRHHTAEICNQDDSDDSQRRSGLFRFPWLVPEMGDVTCFSIAYESGVLETKSVCNYGGIRFFFLSHGDYDGEYPTHPGT